MVDFKTEPIELGTKYRVTDLSTDVGGAGYKEKRIIITALNGAVIYDQVSDYTQTIVDIDVTQLWTSTLAIVSIQISLTYLYETRGKGYLLPTTTNSTL